MSPKNTIKNLNSLRFILILMIMVSHYKQAISQGMSDYLGECAVAIFFVISGFVLSLSYGEKLEKREVSNKKFFLTRIFKLYPLHLFILAIIIPLDWRLGHLGNWYQNLAQAFLLQCWIPSHDFVAVLNGSTWFISDIIFFYLIFKYLYRWIMRFPWIHLTFCLGIAMASYITFSLYIGKDYSNSYIYFYPPFRLIDFCIGIFVYKYYFIKEKKVKNISNAISTMALTSRTSNISDILIVLMIGSLYYLSLNVNPNFRCAALYWLPTAITVYYMVISDNRNGWLSKLFHNKILLWLGSISFEIYLWHELCFRIIQSIFLKIFSINIPHLGLQFIASLCLTIIIAWASKRFLVNPVYNYVKKHI